MPTEDGQKLRHACSTCARSFSNKRDLVKHQYMHREKPNLVCLHCSKTFTTESNYRRHINALQNVEKKGYNCGNCGSLFRRLRDLEQHHELKHRDDKVFRCKVCQAEFSWHENLLKHQQVHEANPHICTVCQHEFIDMTSLLVHRRTHHLPSSSAAAAAEQPQKAARMVISQQQPETSTEKPFTCHICGRRFKFDFSYQAHLDAHVIPASKENLVDVGQVCEPTSHLSKPVYVQMDSEGIIYLPAFSSSANEDVEIIVEVRNVTTPAAAGTPVSLQIPMTPDKDDRDGATCMKSEMDKKPADNGELRRTSEELKSEQRKDNSSVPGINDDHKDQIALGSVDRNGEDSALTKADENEGPPEIDRMDDVADDDGKPWPAAAAVASFYSYSTRPKKPTKRKRERVPFQFNCVMTDDKPFVCFTCGEAFRWEISLQVHTKVHTEGKVPGVRKIYNSAGAADKRKVMKCEEKVKNNAAGEPGIKKSRIVYRRDSSDEEDMVEDMFAFGNDPEEVEGGSQVALYHGKKLGEKTLRPDNADDMLQEYLVGNEGFISLEESNALAENETEDCSLQAEDVLHNKLREKHKTVKKKLSDDSWRKGKAILRKKLSWKSSKQRPEAQTDAIHSAEESVGQQAVESETLSGGGNLVESLGNSDKAHEHNELYEQDVIDAEDEDKKRSFCPPYKVAEHGCLDEFRAVDYVAEGDGGGGRGTEVGLNDDRIAMAAAYAAVAQPSAEPGLLQNGIIKDELLVDAGAEQGDDALCLSVAMDTDCISHQETASEQVQNVNARSSIALSASLHHHETDRRADDVVTGKTSPAVGECVVSVSHDIQQNLSVSVRIPVQRAEIEPLTTSDGLIPSQGVEADPHTTSAGSISSQGAETDTTISPLHLGENKSNATAYEFKHDDNCSVKICASAGKGEHAKDSMEDMHDFQPVIKEEVSVSTAAAVEVEQHCMAKEFCPAMTSSATATSMSEGNEALSPKPMTLVIAGSIYSANSESDETLKDAALQRKYPFKQRNVRQVSHLFQSFKARCFSKKSLTLKKSVKVGTDVIPSNVPRSAHGTITNICVQCGKHFTSDRSLKRHRMRHRSSVKIVSFKCPYCWKRFSTLASLDQHLISLHVPSVASCETCHKQFTTLDSVTLHQRHGCVFTAYERK